MPDICRIVRRHSNVFGQHLFVFGPGSPVPRQLCFEGCLWNIFKEREYLNQLVAHFRRFRQGRNGEAAVAHNDGGSAKSGQGFEFWFPPHGAVKVRMTLDKARRYNTAGCVLNLLFVTRFDVGGYVGDNATFHADICPISGRARSVNQHTAAY